MMFEVVVISLFLLQRVPVAIHYYDFSEYFEKPGILMNHTLDKNISPAMTELLVKVQHGQIGHVYDNYKYEHDDDNYGPRPRQRNLYNVEKIFMHNTTIKDYETATLTSIAVYSTPLGAPFRSSKTPVSSAMQGQYFGVDYHSYVVFETSDGMWGALDKMPEGIFVSWGRSRDSVLFYIQKQLRPNPVHQLVYDESSALLIDLVRRLRRIVDSNKYDVVDKNCQNFAKVIFDKFAEDLTWEFTSPVDLTSVFKLFTDRGDTLYRLLLPLFFIFELYLLFMKSKETGSSHYQYVVYIVIFVSCVLRFFVGSSVCEDLRFYPFWTLIGILPVEAVFYSSLGSIRRRAAQYGEMLNNGNMFEKLVWLPLCFTILYVTHVYSILIFLPVDKLYHYHKEQQLSVLYPLLSIATWWHKIGFVNYFFCSFLCYIATVPYLMWVAKSALPPGSKQHQD